jgi:putative phosphoserine phosphatase / 1-acylglycerol-3-phosphate O-acyltransferase
VMRGATVRVDVLPPVDTSGWSAKTMNAHVAEVRAMFLQVLGQEDSPSEPRKPAKAKKKAPANPRKKAGAE